MRRALACIAFGVVATSTVAAAQQRDTTRSDSTRRATIVRRLGPVIVTDSRLAGVGGRTSARVDEIHLDVAPAGPAAAYQILHRRPGVNLFDDQGSRLQPELNLRGFSISHQRSD